MLHFCDTENYTPRIKSSLSSANFVERQPVPAPNRLWHFCGSTCRRSRFQNAQTRSGPMQPCIQCIPGLIPRGKVDGAWGWPYTSIHCRGQEWVELFTSTTLYAFRMCIGKTSPFTCQRGLYGLHFTLLKDRKLKWICKTYFCCRTYLSCCKEYIKKWRFNMLKQTHAFGSRKRDKVKKSNIKLVRIKWPGRHRRYSD